MEKRSQTHKVRVIDDPYPKSAPGLFKAACTCDTYFLSRRTREEAQQDADDHVAEV